MKNKKDIFNEMGFSIPIFVCVMFSLFSPFILSRYNTVLSLFLLLLWILIALANKRKCSKNEILSLLFYSYLVIIPYIMGYSFVGNRYLVLAIFILGNSIGSYCEYANKWESISKILKIVAPFLLYEYIKTFFALRTNPYASRLIKTSGEYTRQARTHGIGGYEFIYFLAMLVSICMGLFFLLKSKKQKVICLLICILSFVEIVLSNYMTAFLIATVGIVLTILMLLIRKNQVWLAFLLLSVGIFILFGNEIMKFVLEIFLQLIPQNGKTFARLYSMKNSFFHSIVVEFLSDRSYTTKLSLECFLSHPILGIIGENGLQNSELLSNIGQHSYFIDTFAFYGFGIGIFGIANYFSLFKKKYFDGSLIIITIPTIFCGFMLLLFNNVTMSIGVIIGIIYPYTLYLLKKQEQERVKHL